MAKIKGCSLAKRLIREYTLKSHFHTEGVIMVDTARWFRVPPSLPPNLLTNSMPITHFFYFFMGGRVEGVGEEVPKVVISTMQIFFVKTAVKWVLWQVKVMLTTNQS